MSTLPISRISAPLQAAVVGLVGFTVAAVATSQSGLALVLVAAAGALAVVVALIKDPFWGLPLFLALRLLAPVLENNTLAQVGFGLVLWTTAGIIAAERRIFRTPRFADSFRLPPRFIGPLALLTIAVLIPSLPRMLDFETFLSLKVVEGETHVNREMYMILANAVLLATLIVRLLDNERKVRRLIDCYIVIGFALAAGGFLTYLGYVQPPTPESDPAVRLRTFTGISSAATGERLMVPTSLSLLLLGSTRGVPRLALLVVAAVNLSAMLLSATRAAYVGCAVALVVAAALNARRHFWKTLIVVGIAAIIVTAAASNWETIDTHARTVVGNERLTSGEHYLYSIFELRAQRWSVALEAIAGSWVVGYGLGSSKEVVGVRLPESLGFVYGSLHNLYLGWLVDTGVLGGLALLVLVGVTTRNFYVASVKASGRLGAYSRSLLATFWGGASMYLVDSDPVFDVLFLAFFGLSFAVLRASEHADGTAGDRGASGQPADGGDDLAGGRFGTNTAGRGRLEP